MFIDGKRSSGCCDCLNGQTSFKQVQSFTIFCFLIAPRRGLGCVVVVVRGEGDLDVNVKFAVHFK